MDISRHTKDHFDHVLLDNDYLHAVCDRWPDEPNGGSCDEDDLPPVTRVRTSRVFIATQSAVGPGTVAIYADALANGAKMPPIVGIKCPQGIIVWNGHHRLAAHRLAGKKTIPARFWGKVDAIAL